MGGKKPTASKGGDVVVGIIAVLIVVLTLILVANL